MNWQSQLIALLSASLLRPFILAAAVWLVLRLLKIRHPASQHAAWTTVLIGMLLLPTVTLLAPHWKLPILPAEKQKDAAPVSAESAGSGTAVAPDIPLDAGLPAPNAQTRTGIAWPSGKTLIVCCYLTGVFFMAFYFFTGWVRMRRLLADANRIRAHIRESGHVLTPVTAGLLRPSVILPVDWRGWNSGIRRAVLAHEFAHIRRRDTLTSSASRVAKCIFWFHPLTWWLSQRISDLAELSCDAAALEKMDDPAGYSRILLGFAAAVKDAGYRAALPGLPMASGARMEWRIDRVFELGAGNLRRLSLPVLATTALPTLCLAAVVGLTAPPARILHPAAPPSVPAILTPTQPIQLAQSQPAPRAAATPTALPSDAPPAEPAEPRPAFDAAAVRRCMPGDEKNGPPGGRGRGGGGGGGRGPRFSPGRLRVQCLSVAAMIRIAYVNNDQLLNYNGLPADTRWLHNAPEWVNSDWYTVDAETNDPTANGSTDAPRSAAQRMLSQMLQLVLEDRFQLKMHRATEDVAMYNLTVSKGGFKLKPMEEDGCVPFQPGSPLNAEEMFPPGKKPLCITGMRVSGQDWLIDGGGQSLSNLAEGLSRALNRHVFDKTDRSDLFNYHLRFAHDETTPGEFPPDMAGRLFPPSDDPPGPSIFTAVDQMGLKLEPTKGPEGYVIIDRVARPSEN